MSRTGDKIYMPETTDDLNGDLADALADALFSGNDSDTDQQQQDNTDNTQED